MASKTRLVYHLILTTRYRRPALAGIEHDVYQAMREAEKVSSFKIIDMGIEGGNHIHMVIKANPKYSISSYVNRIKAISQKRLWAARSIHLNKHYWGPRKKLWHGAYYCSTVGKVSESKVLEYVASQDGPRPTQAIHQLR